MEDDSLSFEVSYAQLPLALQERAIAAGTPSWMMMLLGFVLMNMLYIFPLFATFAALGAWTSSRYAHLCQSILWYLQPCLGGIIFSLGVWMAVPAIQPLGDFLLDSQTSGFCQRFEDMTDTACLHIVGEYRLGHWFLFLQSLALEVWVILTLLWRKA